MPEEAESKKEEKRTSIVLIIILVVAMFLVAGYFLILPAYNNLSNLRVKLATQQETKKNQADFLQNLKQLLANYSSIKSGDKQKISEMLPTEVDEPALFTLFETLAARNNMVVLAIDISEKEPSAEIKNLGVREVQIAANLAGGEYADLKNLLDDLEKNLRLMDVVSVSYMPDPSAVVLNIKTYFLEKSSAGK